MIRARRHFWCCLLIGSTMIKDCAIDLETWELIAYDRLLWRRSIPGGIQHFEAEHSKCIIQSRLRRRDSLNTALTGLVCHLCSRCTLCKQGRACCTPPSTSPGLCEPQTVLIAHCTLTSVLDPLLILVCSYLVIIYLTELDTFPQILFKM